LSRRTTNVLLALGSIAGAALAAPYGFGMRIESWFEESIAQAPPNPFYQLEIERYERGWRTSHAVTALKISPPDHTPVTLRFDSRIEHGPIIGGLRQARITTTPVLSPEITAVIGPMFGAQPPLVSVIDVAISGAVDGAVDSPAASAAVGAIGVGAEWKGLRSHFHLDPSSTAVDFAGEIPGVSFGPSGGQPILRVAGVTFSGTGTKSDTSGLWLSSSTFELGQLELLDPGNGNGASRLEKLRMTSSSDEKDGLIQMAGGLSAAEATIRESAVKDFALEFSLHDIDAASMKKFREFLEAHSTPPAQPDPQTAQLLVAQMQSLAGGFLARKPWFAIDRLGFVYQDEPFSANARVQYLGAGNLAAFNPISDLGGRFSFEAPQSAVQTIVESRQLNELMQQRASLSSASGVVVEPTLEEQLAMQAQASALAGQKVLEMIMQHWIVPAGAGRWKAEAVLENGAITLNGRPFTPPLPTVAP
jgi:uncharacterized protein YdgA (DUF945 family)